MYFYWQIQWKLTNLTVKYIFFAGESVKKQITDSISENLSDSDLESTWNIWRIIVSPLQLHTLSQNAQIVKYWKISITFMNFCFHYNLIYFYSNEMKNICKTALKRGYTEEKILLNQKHFFPKAFIVWIHKNILQELINMLLILQHSDLNPWYICFWKEFLLIQ